MIRAQRINGFGLTAALFGTAGAAAAALSLWIVFADRTFSESVAWAPIMLLPASLVAALLAILFGATGWRLNDGKRTGTAIAGVMGGVLAIALDVVFFVAYGSI